MAKFLDEVGLTHYTGKVKGAMLDKSGSKNILNNVANPYTSSNLTMAINEDKSISINGTTTDTMFYFLGKITIPAGTYVMSKDNTKTAIWLYNNIISGDDSWICSSSSTATKTFTTEKTFNIYIRLATNSTFTNEIIYPMICTQYDYNLSPNYVPYQMTNYELTNNVATNIEIDAVWNNS